MSLDYSYRHLYYLWVVAKEGGIARAATRLGMAVQTVSAQVRELEKALGHALLKPAGRGIALTEAGQAAVRQADLIFQLGEQLPEVVRDAADMPAVRLAVGISDGLPKLAVQRLMEPLMRTPHLRLLCHEGEFDQLLGELALHRLDIVLSDRVPASNPNLKIYSHSLGASGIRWYAPPVLVGDAKRGFPASLARVPVLLPTTHSALRARLDLWFEKNGVRPRIVGEFEDSALLATFGAGGLGAFPAAVLVHDELVRRYGVRSIGECPGVEEHFHVIGTERRVMHPLVQKLIDTHHPRADPGRAAG